MAADWLKVEISLPGKPEVLALADALDISRDEVIGKLIRWFSWIDQQLTTDKAGRMELRLVDAVIGMDGFGAALVDVGWLEETEDGLAIPKFDRHLSQGSKRRALELERQRRRRKGLAEDDEPPARTRQAEKPVATGDEPSEHKFILAGGETWVMGRRELAELGPLYPGVNIPAELRKCAAWVEREATRRKRGVSGMRRCIHSWLDRTSKQSPVASRPLNFNTD